MLCNYGSVVCLLVAVCCYHSAVCQLHEDHDLATLMGEFQLSQLLEEEAELMKALNGAKMSRRGSSRRSMGHSMGYSDSDGYGRDRGDYDYYDGGYGADDGDYGHEDYGDRYQERSGGYSQQQQQSGYGQSRSSGGYGRRRKKVQPVKLPVKREKKMKIISIDKGFYIPGGTQMFGKFKTLKGCMKACAATPNCFAGDYNPWFGRCYVHSNLTACNTLRAHKKLTHFKKVPCTVPEAPNGLIVLGAQLFKGLEQKGLKSLTDCLKKCATAGPGIQATFDLINNQVCFGIDYDFGTHKCYFHVSNVLPDNRICSDANPLLTPRDLFANPSTVFIALCPDVTPAE